LHARTLGFKHPKTGKEMDFTTDLAADMVALLAKWDKYIEGIKA
jgi:23S rRNA pseudouridine1911/1915/1917 synthase